MLPGSVLADRFMIELYLAEGSCGEVWAGYDQQRRQPVAIKRFYPDWIADKAKKSGVVEEARRLTTLSHPNVVRIYDVLDIRGEIFLIMERLNDSLRDWLRALVRADDWLPPSAAFRLTREILSGLAAVHGCADGAIVHCDLTPANIMFGQNRTAKIVDFGFATIAGPDEVAGKIPLMFGGPFGSPGYKSPEQFEGRLLDPLTDLFNVGIVAYLAFARVHPFADERLLFSHEEMILESPRPTPTIDATGLPPELSPFVLRLLEKSPSKRFESAAQALSELATIETKFPSHRAP